MDAPVCIDQLILKPRYVIHTHAHFGTGPGTLAKNSQGAPTFLPQEALPIIS